MGTYSQAREDCTAQALQLLKQGRLYFGEGSGGVTHFAGWRSEGLINLAFFTSLQLLIKLSCSASSDSRKFLVTCNGMANYKERIETYYWGPFEDMWPERGHVGRAGGGRTNPKVKGLHGTYRNV